MAHGSIRGLKAEYRFNATPLEDSPETNSLGWGIRSMSLCGMEVQRHNTCLDCASGAGGIRPILGHELVQYR